MLDSSLLIMSGGCVGGGGGGGGWGGGFLCRVMKVQDSIFQFSFSFLNSELNSVLFCLSIIVRLILPIEVFFIIIVRLISPIDVFMFVFTCQCQCKTTMNMIMIARWKYLVASGQLRGCFASI